MSAGNAVQLIILVWTFTAVCQDDDGLCSISCKNVTGTVCEEVTFICSVSLKHSECCIARYKFKYPEKYKDSTVCKQDLPEGSCEQRNNFTCRYTPTTAMTEKFRFFVQTTCGIKRTEFTVNITGLTEREIETEAPDLLSISCADVTGTVGEEVTFTCSVSQQCSECCIIKYTFLYTEKYKNSTICRQDLPLGSCEQRNSFTCRYTPTTAMTGHFRFLLQTTHGMKRTEFTVSITEPIRPEIDTEDPGLCSMSCADVTGTVGEEVTFTCSVSQQCSECCIIKYKFQYPEKYDSTICRQDLPQDSCEQRNSFTCRYTPTTTVPRPFRFMAQTKCVTLNTEDTVDKTDVCSVSYEDVTETVGKEATLTCSVPQKLSECCMTMYKFYYTEIYKDHKVICKQEFPLDSCDQRNNYTCRYTPTTAMTGKFSFFVQTVKCGTIKTEFTVDITEHSKLKTETEDPGHGSPLNGAAVGCFITIIIIFIIGMSVYCVKRFKRSNPSGLQIE
ncbi:uncharacterized protein LOC127523260 [Ctenopharyngodon idella]|uniref:uncharacterized protein LOC127523260 n=1 Tax=Ctenopharyngodon idella TaxID=7959 RepID=UPI00222EFC48|nr:uncharacterized protein LOC127523260 [Ctenopharyngodon idella]